MVKKELVDYIKKETKAGYDVSYLRNYLVKQGYSAKDVDEAISSIYKKPAKVEIPGKFILIGLIAVVVIIGGIFAIVKLAQLEREEAIMPPSEIEPQVQIPPALPEQQEIAPEEEEPQVEVRYVPPAQMSIGQVIDRIPYISEREAVNLCRKFIGNEKDGCFNRVALEKGNSDLCAEIVNIRKRDNCYMNFAYFEDYSVCVKIQDIYLKQSCRELGKLEFNITGS